MGIQFLNGVPYGTTRQIRELTQAEYDALPSSKYTDGILYCITDDGMVEGNKFAPIIYSSEEREIGTWDDGKPLYAVTKDLPPANVNQWVVGATLASNCEIKLCTGYIIDSQYEQQFPVEGGFCYTNVNDYSGGSVGFNVFKFTPKQGINAKGGKVTLYYTKTTDTPGSGKWSTYGVPNHHYSTDEHIVGTWIDGKPLYEKTCAFLGLNIRDAEQLLSSGISNVDKMINMTGFYLRTPEDVWEPMPVGHTRMDLFCVSANDFNTSNGNFNLVVGTMNGYFYVKDCYIIFKYTKTTD